MDSIGYVAGMFSDTCMYSLTLNGNFKYMLGGINIC